MLKRKIDSILLNWKNDINHNPLIIYGARQIGKTTSVEYFGQQNYESVVSINFIEHPEYQHAFDNYDPNEIIAKLSLYNPSFKFIPHKTLLFFDEIQAFMDATTSLKFFKQDGRYDVICSGSSLGIFNKAVSSVAVGFKEEVIMYSMDFEEFLWAKGYNSSVLEDVLNHMTSCTPLSNAQLDIFNKLFMEYVLVGGYPKIVNEFIHNQNYTNILKLQKEQIKDYQDDITKYLDGLDIVKTMKVFNSIAPQLSKDNHKFQFTKIGHGARFSSYYGCAEWIRNAGIAIIANNIPVLSLPLKGNEDDNNFRMYFSDTSLLIASLDEETQEDLKINQNLGVYKGALFENIAACALIKQGYTLYFHRSEDSTVELDFLLRIKNNIVPIEVKAKKGRQLSLNTAMNQCDEIAYGFKFGNYNIGQVNNIATFPLFCITLLKQYINAKNKA